MLYFCKSLLQNSLLLWAINPNQNVLVRNSSFDLRHVGLFDEILIWRSVMIIRRDVRFYGINHWFHCFLFVLFFQCLHPLLKLLQVHNSIAKNWSLFNLPLCEKMRWIIVSSNIGSITLNKTQAIKKTNHSVFKLEPLGGTRVYRLAHEQTWETSSGKINYPLIIRHILPHYLNPIHCKFRYLNYLFYVKARAVRKMNYLISNLQWFLSRVSLFNYSSLFYSNSILNNYGKRIIK